MNQMWGGVPIPYILYRDVTRSALTPYLHPKTALSSFHYSGPLKGVLKTKARDQLLYHQVCNSSTDYQKTSREVQLRSTNCDGQNREMKGRRGVLKNSQSRPCSLSKPKTHFHPYNKLPTASWTSAVDILTSLFFLRSI